VIAILLHTLLALALWQPVQTDAVADTVVIDVYGTMEDSRFDPEVAHAEPGSVILFRVHEGVHTVTAYHPANRRDLAIPDGAEPFDSGTLQAGDEWTLRLTAAGEYNYYCRPHERMGHTGRIILGSQQNL
jgi:plastocyanin